MGAHAHSSGVVLLSEYATSWSGLSYIVALTRANHCVQHASTFVADLDPICMTFEVTLEKWLPEAVQEDAE